MALKLADIIEEMKAALAGEPRESREKVLRLAADFLVRALARDAEGGRAAILVLDRRINVLTFAYPFHLSDGNVVPVDQNSIAGRVALSRLPLIENDLPNEPHKDVFERIPDERGQVLSIQKMLAAPLLGGDGEAVGVVEVSRTATGSPAFTEQDGENLQKTCRVFAPFVVRVCSDGR